MSIENQTSIIQHVRRGAAIAGATATALLSPGISEASQFHSQNDSHVPAGHIQKNVQHSPNAGTAGEPSEDGQKEIAEDIFIAIGFSMLAMMAASAGTRTPSKSPRYANDNGITFHTKKKAKSK